jgi:UDP-MurNAc hydroxylase
MKLRYIYSACVVIETEDTRLLCDPWFTPGAYDGAWQQYPILSDPVAAIGPVDWIFISHIHPDHYDPVFLRRYLAAYPEARLVIGAQDPAFLEQKMRADGHAPTVVERMKVGETELRILPNEGEAGRKSEIDTALVIRRGRHSIVNMNDNPFEPEQVAGILDFCPGGRPDLALLPYSGAGPYPQTFHFPDQAALAAAALAKCEQFVALFAHYLDALKPVMAMPFAGKYYLGGRLAGLNRHRGVPDAVDVARRFAGRSLVLADGGQATYDVVTGQASACRDEPYDPAAIERHLGLVGAAPFDYEREIRLDVDHAFPFLPLMTAAKRRARSKVRPTEPYWIVVKPESLKNAFMFNVADDQPPAPADSARKLDCLHPRLEIQIDDRYLFGLLTRLYHWNNAEVGSQYRSVRVPDEYRRDVYAFLNMFQV